MVQLNELDIETEEALKRIHNILSDDTCSDADTVVMVCINALRFMYRTQYATKNWTNIHGWFGGLLMEFTEEAMADATLNNKEEEV